MLITQVAAIRRVAKFVLAKCPFAWRCDEREYAPVNAKEEKKKTQREKRL